MFPDFSLPDQDEVTRKLSDYRGKRVILKLPIITIPQKPNISSKIKIKSQFLFEPESTGKHHLYKKREKDS